MNEAEEARARLMSGAGVEVDAPAREYVRHRETDTERTHRLLEEIQERLLIVLAIEVILALAVLGLILFA